MEPETQTNQTKTGPNDPTFLTLVLKTLAGLGGGISGMLILLLIFLGASTILQSAFNPELGDQAGKNPLFIFVFMAMIFLTSLGANLIGSLFFTFVDHDKYSRTSTVMYQVFFVNVVIFVLLAPIYLLLDTRGLLDLTGFLAGFHVLLSSIASVMILEILGNLRYALVGVYGIVFSMMISTGMMLVIYEFSGRNPTIVLFAALPFMWTTLGFVTVICEMLYRWLYTIYGTDFLMSGTSFGVDYGENEPEEKEPAPDVEGSTFLGK